MTKLPTLFIGDKQKAANDPKRIPVAFKEVERWANNIDIATGGYASLQGTGQTASPGDLTQNGGLTVYSGGTNANIVLDTTLSTTVGGGSGQISLISNTEILLQAGVGPVGTSQPSVTIGSQDGILLSNRAVGTNHLPIEINDQSPTGTTGLWIHQTGSGGINISDDFHGGLQLTTGGQMTLSSYGGSAAGVFLTTQGGSGLISLNSGTSVSGGTVGSIVLNYSAGGVTIGNTTGDSVGPSSVRLHVQNVNPNGIVTGSKGDIVFDVGTPAIWINTTFGNTGWVMYTNP